MKLGVFYAESEQKIGHMAYVGVLPIAFAIYRIFYKKGKFGIQVSDIYHLGFLLEGVVTRCFHRSNLNQLNQENI